MPGIKAVSISGALTAEDLQESQVRPDGFLRKPLTSIELFAVVGLLVG